ncbi:hypothetical protein C0995_011306 [Termitomyces sp. Mi166|nr:hypothetical protein C0995_011306 [Termitomyces sp. Mi166\
MDMDGTNTTMSMGDAMIPYLHFTRGDYLLFKTWKPTSTGAVAGACIGLVLLAIFERWLFAVRSALDYHWRRKGLALASLGINSRPIEDTEKPLQLKSHDSQGQNPLDVIQRPISTFTRTIPPFIFAHDIPRGLLHGGQALLAYVLMLSVIVSINVASLSESKRVDILATPIMYSYKFNMVVLFAALALLTGVDAHFRLLYPEPRGPFVADQEPNFCGGYTDAVANRSTFPLSGGFFSIKTGHPDWTSGVLISTAQNPVSFDNFSVNGVQQIVGPYAKETNAGTFCIPLNISAAGIEGVQDGSNVTIQTNDNTNSAPTLRWQATSPYLQT